MASDADAVVVGSPEPINLNRFCDLLEVLTYTLQWKPGDPSACANHECAAALSHLHELLLHTRICLAAALQIPLRQGTNDPCSPFTQQPILKSSNNQMPDASPCVHASLNQITP